MERLRNKYGSIDRVPQPVREEFRRRSLPIMPMTNILTFNTRAIALYICCLVDFPWLYYFFEIVVLSALWAYMHWRHERFCRVFDC